MENQQVGLPGKSEDMVEFFDLRAAGYERHMTENIEDFSAFYDSVSAALPDSWRSPRVLDLGVGTGLELDWLFERFPTARVTGIDLSQGMLDQLAGKQRSWSKRVRLVRGSFLEIDLGRAEYDGVVSVMALHHWIPEVKLDLYRRVRRCLVSGGVFVNADYVESEEEWAKRLAAYDPKAHGDRHPLHIDLPLPHRTELQLLREAGFGATRIAFRRRHTATFIATALRPQD
jgi:tRNA (cmo5U34)-methyltransferase